MTSVQSWNATSESCRFLCIYMTARSNADFVPEHEETEARQASATFSEFLADLREYVATSEGRFKTLRDRTPFLAEFLKDHSLQIRRDSGKVERLIALEELETAWAMLQTGLLTADQYRDESSRRYKSYIFSTLAELPYVRLAEIQQARAGNRPVGHGLLLSPEPFVE